MAQHPGHSDEDLLDQWAFLDTIVERQASQLRAGIQDEDEPAVADSPEVADLTARLSASESHSAEMRTRVDDLSADVTRLRADLAERSNRIVVLESTLEAARAQLADAERALAAMRAPTPPPLVTDPAPAAPGVELPPPPPSPPAAVRRWWQR